MDVCHYGLNLKPNTDIVSLTCGCGCYWLTKHSTALNFTRGLSHQWFYLTVNADNKIHCNPKLRIVNSEKHYTFRLTESSYIFSFIMNIFYYKQRGLCLPEASLPLNYHHQRSIRCMFCSSLQSRIESLPLSLHQRD